MGDYIQKQGARNSREYFILRKQLDRSGIMLSKRLIRCFSSGPGPSALYMIRQAVAYESRIHKVLAPNQCQRSLEPRLLLLLTSVNGPIGFIASSLAPARAAPIHSVITTLNGNMANISAIDKNPVPWAMCLVLMFNSEKLVFILDADSHTRYGLSLK